MRMSVYLTSLRSLALRDKGFSLVEVLVVLVLVSMMSTLLLQGTTFLYGNYARAVSLQEAFRSQQLPLSWFRNSVSQLVANLDDEFYFEGDRTKFSGFTLAPLHGEEGAFTAVTWRLDVDGRDIRLWYDQPGHQSVLVRHWRGADASFSYMTETGAFISSWPEHSDKPEMLPHAIRLRFDAEELGRYEVLSSVNMRTEPEDDYRDIL